MNDTPFLKTPRPATERYDTHVANPWVQQNRFLTLEPEPVEPPAFSMARALLPDPFWAGHTANIDCYWRAWELSFSNLKSPTRENDFVSSYSDTAFNGNLFMWDSAFITAFGGYGRRAFNFQKTLDNFYRKQHSDGFICREISEEDGQDAFLRFDPSSTGPNVLAWAEWNDYCKTADTRRLEMVFPALVAYHQWTRAFRTWPDGSYWSTGWGTGMDNLPRWSTESQSDPARHLYWGHGHMSWVDATLQAALSARILQQMAEVLHQENLVTSLADEAERLCAYANDQLWDENVNFYCDRFFNGTFSSAKHIGGFWALLSGCVPASRVRLLVEHLENPAEFNRCHRIPALSADHPDYTGEYWSGGVWAPTNFMVMKGLDQVGCGDLAHRIALNHNDRVVQVFQSDDTPWLGAEQFRSYFHLDSLQVDDHHTLWEDYAPDRISPNSHARPGYVGWTGLPPIAVLFEDIFGLVPNAPAKRLTWNVRLLDEHGVRRYPFGPDGNLSLLCHTRASHRERPEIEIHSNVPLVLDVIWEEGTETIDVKKDSG